jgi:hypothetical protein
LVIHHHHCVSSGVDKMFGKVHLLLVVDEFELTYTIDLFLVVWVEARGRNLPL